MNAFVGYLIIVIIAIVFMVTIGFQWNKRKTPLNKNFESFITAGIDPETLGQVPIQAYDPTDGQEKMAHTWHLKTPGGMGAGPSNYSWQQPIGYNWSQSWRPYFWRLYPNIPQWIPAGRDPQANQTPMPHDKELLRLMESPCQPGVSPEGYRYFYRVEEPYQPLCVDYSDKVCREQPNPHFCFRRTVAKCLAGLL